MSYAQSLGAEYTIGLPVVGNKTISIPVEQMAADAVASALPPLQAALPGMISQATPMIIDQVTKQMPKLTSEIGKSLPGMLKRVKPQIEAAIDETTAPLKLGAVAAVAAIIGTTILSARWVKTGKILF